MKKVFYLLSMFSFLFFAACSSDDDNGSDNPDNGGEDGFTEISLEASANEIEIGESITFTVIADEGEDVTAMASIDVDGNVLESNTFVAEEAGNFEATAVLDELTSNSVGFVVNETEEEEEEEENSLLIENGISQFVYLGDFDLEGQMVGEWAVLTANIDENDELVSLSQLNFITEPGNSLNEFSTIFGSILVLVENEGQALFDATQDTPDEQPEDLNFDLSSMDFETGLTTYIISATLPNNVSFEATHNDVFNFIDQTEEDGGADRPALTIDKNSIKSAY